VAHQPPRRLRRIKGIPPEGEVRNNSPPPPQRRQLDLFDTFLLISQTEIIYIDPPKVNASKLEDVIIEDLGVEEFALQFNPPLSKTFPFPIVQVPTPR
jgi:hypothetical protein